MEAPINDIGPGAEVDGKEGDGDGGTGPGLGVGDRGGYGVIQNGLGSWLEGEVFGRYASLSLRFL